MEEVKSLAKWWYNEMVVPSLSTSLCMVSGPGALPLLLGGEVDFKVVGGFEVSLVVEFPLVLVNVKVLGGRGARALRGPIDSNRSFPVMSNLRIFLEACETLRHILDFRSSVSCFGLG